MKNDEEFILKVISNKSRREILFLLRGRLLTFSDIMSSLNIGSSNLAFHLKNLEILVEKIGDKYCLTQKGRRVTDLLLEMRKMQSSKDENESIPTIGNVRVLNFKNKDIEGIGCPFNIENVTLLRIERDVTSETVNRFFNRITNVQVIEAPRELYPFLMKKIQDFGEFIWI